MKGLLRICLFSMVLLTANRAIAVSITTTMDFEDLIDGQLLASYYCSGIKFEAGAAKQDWIALDATTGNYNVISSPTEKEWQFGDYWMYDNVCAWTGTEGYDGKISFDNEDATFVEMGYCSGVELHLEAYDSFDTLLDSVIGPPNRHHSDDNETGPGTLRVEWDKIHPISYVRIYDTGNFWVVDNISTDATGILPEPTTISLFGLGGLALLRKRRA